MTASFDLNPQEMLNDIQTSLDAGELDLALGMCERMIEILPDYAPVWRLLAQIQEELEALDDALRAAEMGAQAAAAQLSAAWDQQAVLLLTRGEYEAAYKIDKQLVRLDAERRAIAGYRMAIALTSLQDVDRGAQALYDAVTARPDLLDRALMEDLLGVHHPWLIQLKTKTET